jgi:hypothetical protein
MSQAIGSNGNGGAQGFSYGLPGASGSTDLNSKLGGNSFNEASPMFGPMQGGSTGSASQDHLMDLLNIDPLKDQTAQLGVAPTDYSSPLEYNQNVLNPILSSASETYHSAMEPPKPKHTGFFASIGNFFKSLF